MPKHEGLGPGPGLARATFDAVAGEREWGPGEADHGDGIVEPGPGRRDGVHDEAEAIDVDKFPNPIQIGRLTHRIVDHRSLAGREFEVEPHRFEDRQQVAEDDGCIDAEPLDRGDHHLGGEAGCLAEFQEAHVLADGPVLRQIPACLPHQPDRRAFHRFAPARAHEQSLLAGIGGAFGQRGE